MATSVSPSQNDGQSAIELCPFLGGDEKKVVPWAQGMKYDEILCHTKLHEQYVMGELAQYCTSMLLLDAIGISEI